MYRVYVRRRILFKPTFEHPIQLLALIISIESVIWRFALPFIPFLASHQKLFLKKTKLLSVEMCKQPSEVGWEVGMHFRELIITR